MALEAPKADIPATGIPRKPLPVDRPFSAPRKEVEKRNNTPLLVGIFFVLLVGSSVYFVYFYLPKLMAELNIQQQNKKVQIKNADWDTIIFQSPVFKSLQASPSIVTESGLGAGNPNPFAKKLK